MTRIAYGIKKTGILYRRHIWRKGRAVGILHPIRGSLAFAGSFYSLGLILTASFNIFWIIFLFLYQLSDKNQNVNIFPAGLNDGVAIMPLTFLAFASALLAAQASVNDIVLKGLYGYAGRSFIHGFFFLGMSFSMALGHRLIPIESFKNFRYAPILEEAVKITPMFMYVNAAVAGCFFVGGLFALLRIFSRHD